MISKSELKFIRLLKIKKYRTAERCFLIEGEKNVLELLNSKFKVRRLIGTKDFSSKHRESMDNLVYDEVTPKILSEISALSTNETVLAVAEMNEFSARDLDMSAGLFVLDGIRDPGNLGTIIRTLDWFGFNQLICSDDTVEFYNPKVISASMGSFTRMTIVYQNLAPFLANYRGPRLGAEMSGQTLNEVVVKAPFAIIMGSESHGISDELRPLIDQSITIPRVGVAESLNVGVATGIICHQLTAKKM